MKRQRPSAPPDATPAFAGVDTHKKEHVLALLDEHERLIGTYSFPTTEQGCRNLACTIGSTDVVVGVEGTGSYGARLARVLDDAGFNVIEVIRPKREQRWHGKSDPLDAIAAAENVAAEKGVPYRRRDGIVARLRHVLTIYEQLNRQQTQTSNCVCSLMTSDGFYDWSEYLSMTTKNALCALAKTRKPDLKDLPVVRAAKHWVRTEKDLAGLEKEMLSLVSQIYPNLICEPGVGPVSAAILATMVGEDISLIESEAAFAKMCGVIPIPASSGSTSGHMRLNRGGNRSANAALYRIAVVRMATDKQTQEYIANKMAKGSTKRDAIRCLKRYIARRIYKLMKAKQVPLPDTAELRLRRENLGLSQRALASAADLKVSAIGQAERKGYAPRVVLEAYQKTLDELEKVLDALQEHRGCKLRSG